MKYYKRLSIHRKNPTVDRFVVEQDGRIITDSTNSLELPTGTAAQRPAAPIIGQIRFNTELGVGGELEAYINGQWEIIKTNRQATISQQEFDNGDYADSYFGPLSYDVNINAPQNILVYVENVPQIANINYSLAYSSVGTPITTATTVTVTAPANTTTLYVASVADFNPGNSISGTNLDINTTIVDTSATDKTITLSLGTTNTVNSLTEITTTFATTGTYVRFSNDSLPVPNKPVIVLQGFDGYGPPFEV